MELLNEIYAIRERLGRLRQSSHQQALDEGLALTPIRNPLLPTAMKHIRRVPWYLNGCTGPVASTDKTYYYRLHSASGLVNYTELSNSSNAHKVFEKLRNDAKHAKSWINLSAYASGTYASPRSFSFWTDAAYDVNDSFIEALYKSGLPSDWIPMNAVVLRCCASAVCSFVPTVIDSCDMPIFEPVCLEGRAKSGRAIDLSETPKLKIGNHEFLLPAIPTDAIELLPVVIDTNFFEGTGRKTLKDVFSVLGSYQNESTFQPCAHCL